MRLPKLVGLAAASCVLAVNALAQAPAPKALDAAQKKQAVEELSNLLADNYVFPEVATKVSDVLRQNLAAGSYDSDGDASSFARALTRDLQAVAKDRHLRVGPAPPGWKPPEESEAEKARQDESLRKENYLFEKLEILPGNIGYMDLRGFIETRIAGDTAVGAMAFLANCDALIFDLRQNGGGDPVMIQLLSSYLFRESTHLNDLYFRKGDRRDQFWTLPYVPGKQLVDVPVYVLTSGETFSGAEEFTNNLKVLKRATVIGETTGGGANPGEAHAFGCCFRVFVPTGRAINPTTGTNWEGTGVEPDIKVPAPEALAVARVEALKALAAKATRPEERARYAWLGEAAEASLHPVRLAAKEMESLVGTYGPRKVWLRDGVLTYQREGRPSLVMTPMTATTFVLEGIDDARFTFPKGPGGKVNKIVVTYSDGRVEESPKQP